LIEWVLLAGDVGYHPKKKISGIKETGLVLIACNRDWL
jgi:hypothetical protein